MARNLRFGGHCTAGNHRCARSEWMRLAHGATAPLWVSIALGNCRAVCCKDAQAFATPAIRRPNQALLIDTVQCLIGAGFNKIVQATLGQH